MFWTLFINMHIQSLTDCFQILLLKVEHFFQQKSVLSCRFFTILVVRSLNIV